MTEAARDIVEEVVAALAGWRSVASDAAITRAEQDRVSPVIRVPAASYLRRS
jgi:hypothetical protein